MINLSVLLITQFQILKKNLKAITVISFLLGLNIVYSQSNSQEIDTLNFVEQDKKPLLLDNIKYDATDSIIIDQKNNKVFSLLGDGELSEGSVWEACTTASKYNLDNLIVIVDRNDLQITGKTEDVNPIEPIDKKFKSFGFETISTNGNNISDLLSVFQHVPVKEDKPTVIIAKTTKGSGVSFIENQINWHHKVPSKDEYESAISELNEKLNSYE